MSGSYRSALRRSKGASDHASTLVEEPVQGFARAPGRYLFKLPREGLRPARRFRPRSPKTSERPRKALGSLRAARAAAVSWSLLESWRAIPRSAAVAHRRLQKAISSASPSTGAPRSSASETVGSTNLGSRFEASWQSLRDGVAERGVREAPGTGRQVVVEVEAGNRREHRNHLAAHQLHHPAGDVLIVHGVVHGLVAEQGRRIGDRHMACVEDAELHGLVGRDVVDELHADVFQRRAALGEVVLDHPLPEGLADDGGRVIQAESAPPPDRARAPTWPA